MATKITVAAHGGRKGPAAQVGTAPPAKTTPSFGVLDTEMLLKVACGNQADVDTTETRCPGRAGSRIGLGRGAEYARQGACGEGS